jgi:hypothetical protein
VDAAFAKVTDVTGAAMLARQLEQIAAATYLTGVEALVDKDAIKLAVSIQIIDMQHVAILTFVLGDYPVPDTLPRPTWRPSPSRNQSRAIGVGAFDGGVGGRRGPSVTW